MNIITPNSEISIHFDIRLKDGSIADSTRNIAQAEGGATLEVGHIFMFTQPNGQEIPGIIQAIDEYEITVDFNHPLAGQVILFDIEVMSVHA